MAVQNKGRYVSDVKSVKATDKSAGVLPTKLLDTA